MPYIKEADAVEGEAYATDAVGKLTIRKEKNMLITGLLFIILIYFIVHQNISCGCESKEANSKCTKCGNEIQDDYNYCPFCKEQIKKECESCGKVIDISWRRCPYCN